ncbi:MAG: DUF1735 domain-containing protein [Bacteroidia bacterium]|nr:DUF1735 domain-containing protein [Bacteroidia bacterium]
MKNIFIIIFTLFAILFITSCDDYGKPDPYVPFLGKDAPDYKTKVYVNTLTSPLNEYGFTATYMEVEKTVTIQGDTIIKFPVKITTPATERMAVKFDVDEKYVTSYNEKNKTDYMLLPKNNYVIKKDEVFIESGQKESKDSILIILKLDEKVSEIEKQVQLPVRIASVNGKTENISSNLDGINVFGRINSILDNVDSSNKLIEGEVFNSGVTLKSNKTTNLSVLINGDITEQFWYPSNALTYVELHLEKEELIKGFKINTDNGRWQFASVRILTSRASGSIVQGTFTTKEVGTEFYIKFKQPVSGKMFRFERFLTLTGAVQPDISEISLIK